jgi:c-di-GMP-binding flagellar brake protein YcgR
VAYTLASLPTPLKLWEKVDVVIGENIDSGKYTARIEDILPNSILISEPEFVSGAVRLREGVVVTIFITRDDASYKFDSVIHQVQRDHLPVFSLMIPKEIHRVQRRQYVRIECNERVSILRIDDTLSEKEITARPWRDTVAIDLSGGGSCLRTHELWNSGERIALRIPFLKTIGVSSLLIAICCRSYEKEGRFYVGVEFIRRNDLSRHFSESELKLLPVGYDGFDHHNQNRLVNFIFQQQIELRKKGLL